MTVPTTFWDDLAEDLKDPEFRRAYISTQRVIGHIDKFLNKEYVMTKVRKTVFINGTRISTKEQSTTKQGETE